VKITWHWKVSFGGPPLPAYAYTILSEPFIVGVPTEWPSAIENWKHDDAEASDFFVIVEWPRLGAQG
jgi:hypothetical protein